MVCMLTFWGGVHRINETFRGSNVPQLKYHNSKIFQGVHNNFTYMYKTKTKIYYIL